jgi:acetyltransferase-like isoleucine patch superfamily enzyme
VNLLNRLDSNHLLRRLKYRLQMLRRRGERKGRIGAGSFIDPSAQVLGWRSVCIGRNSVVSEHCTINVNHYGAAANTVQIGSNVWIAKRNFFSPGELIELADYVMTAPDCHFLGTNHVIGDPSQPYISTGTTEGGRIRVGPNCWLGARVTLFADVEIGHGCVIGAGAIVRSSIPPFSMAVGTPARVVRRYSPVRCAWVKPEELSDEDLRQIPSEADYLKALRLSHPTIYMPWRAAGRSMGDHY